MASRSGAGRVLKPTDKVTAAKQPPLDPHPPRSPKKKQKAFVVHQTVVDKQLEEGEEHMVPDGDITRALGDDSEVQLLSEQLMPTVKELEDFTYTCQWVIILIDGKSKERIGTKPTKQSASKGAAVGEDARVWIEEQIKHRFALKSIELSIGCYGVKRDVFGQMEDFETLLSNLQEWSASKKTALAMTITASVVPVVSSTASSAALAVGVRSTATNIQLANVPQTVTELEETGQGDTLTLVERWPCRSQASGCPNVGHTCWISGREEDKSCHYPLYGEVMAQWAAALKKKEPGISVHDPGSRLAERLIKLKMKKRRSSVAETPAKKRSRRSSVGGVMERYEGERSGPVFYVGCDKGHNTRRAVSEQPSSPIRLGSAHGSDASTDSQTLVEDFFSWCSFRAEWGPRRRPVLQQMKELFVKTDYNLQGIMELPLDVWVAKGLVEGHHPRIRQSYRYWLLQRSGKR